MEDLEVSRMNRNIEALVLLSILIVYLILMQGVLVLLHANIMFSYYGDGEERVVSVTRSGSVCVGWYARQCGSIIWED